MYRTELPAPGDETHPVVVVHCSDPRYQPHFQEFLRTHLKLQRYALVAVPGGPQLLTLTTFLPKFAWAGWRWVKFLMQLTRPARLILIAHDDCRWYIENRFVHDPLRARDHVVGDLRTARRELMARYEGVPVDLFYATLSDSGATFEAL